MKVSVIGSGYVGLVAGAGFAEIGHSVRCVDNDENKVRALNDGVVPIYEPGLDELFNRNRKAGRLTFSIDVPSAVKWAEVVIIAVGTPEREDGSADLSSVLEVARTVGQNIEGYTVVACKSTVPVGTNEKIREVIGAATHQPFGVVSNPEFLREGEAIEDFMHPPRVVIGTDDPRAAETMLALYSPLYGYYDAHDRIVVMDLRSAEVTKYVANAFLATRITFINEMANFCEAVGADITKVRVGAGMDPRIGLYYFHPGCGYGGSCFPKDVQALLRTARSYEHPLKVLEAVDSANDRQKLVPFEKVVARLGEDLSGKTIAVWGLSFKPETDDTRESPAIYVIDKLIEAGATVHAHDPIAVEAFRAFRDPRPRFSEDMWATLDNADALIVITDWKAYREADLQEINRRLRGKVVIDGRNIWTGRQRPEGWWYEGIGFLPSAR
ncbi:MAG: UDP-glucose/GDP-mannose dehydrogenase family protein [Myxococcota bacterium]|jgi:UDPglucose 6-dehydrogenase|nr:UDP-glucose/GDP-mannose dehydrogenase family protein [Myxococcota bacterium]